MITIDFKVIWSRSNCSWSSSQVLSANNLWPLCLIITKPGSVESLASDLFWHLMTNVMVSYIIFVTLYTCIFAPDHTCFSNISCFLCVHSLIQIQYVYTFFFFKESFVFKILAWLWGDMKGNETYEINNIRIYCIHLWTSVARGSRSDPGVAARTLANIADVLGSRAGQRGGLRSGPAANKAWAKAFHLLEVCMSVRFH